jgi:hypothetical protein
MHIGIRFALCVASAMMVLSVFHEPAKAWPAGNRLSTERAPVQLVGDTCWWWGPRWQYGWRGYGWYTCWDEVKPMAPIAIAPEAIPENAALPRSCLRTWRDEAGNLRSRRVC